MSHRHGLLVMPAQAGIHSRRWLTVEPSAAMGSRLRGNDEVVMLWARRIPWASAALDTHPRSMAIGPRPFMLKFQ